MNPFNRMLRKGRLIVGVCYGVNNDLVRMGPGWLLGPSWVVVDVDSQKCWFRVKAVVK